jgi:four helix bundle protein
MKIERFEEIKAWQEARKLHRLIYEITSAPKFRGAYVLRDELQRASLSSMANIAEGFDRQTKKEFVQFLHYSAGSSSEVQSHLYACLDVKLVNLDQFNASYDQAQIVKKLTHGFIGYLKR